MLRRLIVTAAVALMAGVHVGDVHAAKCTPLKDGICHACKNCSSCKHCAKDGGKCSVCQKR